MSDIDDSVPKIPPKTDDPAQPDDRHGSGFNVATRLVHVGSDPARFGGVVNTPVYRASTIISQNLAELRQKRELHASGERAHGYGRFGTPTTHAFEDAVAELEGGYRSLVFPSGLAACTCALTAFVGKDDHILVPDNAYFPLRNFARSTLTRFGVEVEFYQPLDVAGTIARMRDNTRVLYVESPGSITFEVQDIPALAEAAHKRGVAVLMDNTWATPLYFKPFTHGVDVSIQAGTKYLVGHSDAFLGVVTATRRAGTRSSTRRGNLARSQAQTTFTLGFAACVPCRYGWRGIGATELNWQTGSAANHWCNGCCIRRCPRTPAMRSGSGTSQARAACSASSWRRCLKRPWRPSSTTSNCSSSAIRRGGFESLIMLYQSHESALASRTSAAGALVRIHAGLEDVDDLRADLQAAFKRVG